jgi:hypothetical protein
MGILYLDTRSRPKRIAEAYARLGENTQYIYNRIIYDILGRLVDFFVRARHVGAAGLARVVCFKNNFS